MNTRKAQVSDPILFVPSEVGRDPCAGIVIRVHESGEADLIIFHPYNHAQPVDRVQRVMFDATRTSPRSFHFAADNVGTVS